MCIHPAPRGWDGHRAPGGVAELAILRDGDVVAIHPKTIDAHSVCRLLALRQLYLLSSPIELLPDAIDLIRIAAHQELTRRDEHHLGTVYGVGAWAWVMVRGGGRCFDRGFTLTTSQADHQAETDPATRTASRHDWFSQRDPVAEH